MQFTMRNISRELREVIRYYDIKVLDEGREKTKRRVEWWTAEDVTYFTENGDGEFLQEKSCGHWAVTALLDGEGSRNRTAWLGARAFYSAQEQ